MIPGESSAAAERVAAPTDASVATVPPTERLAFRRMTPDDAAFVVELFNDAAFLQNIGDRKIRTIEDAERYVTTGPMASHDANGFALDVVTLRSDGTPIGICGLLRRPTLDDVDVGYALLPAHRGRGYALEALRAVLDHARGTLGIGRIVAIVSPGNEASKTVLRAAGLSFERRIQMSPDAEEIELFG